MKYAPKKVFILESNGTYTEITYKEFKQLELTNIAYRNKKFLPLYGVIMEVSEETYKSYYKERRRQKYIDECSKQNGEVSYDALDTDELLGEETLVDKHTDVEEQVVRKMTLEEVRMAINRLTAEEQELIIALYVDGLTEREYAKRKGVYHNAIHKRKIRILAKLKALLEN